MRRVDARRDPDFFIVARTDARAVDGLDAAVRRARAYIDAGADAIFPEALESADEFRAFARQLAKEGGKAPLVANMTEFGKTPYLSVGEFEDLGYRLVLFPVTALRMATKAIEQMLAELKTRVRSATCWSGCRPGNNSTTCCGMRSMSNEIGNFTQRMMTMRRLRPEKLNI